MNHLKRISLAVLFSGIISSFPMAGAARGESATAVSGMSYLKECGACHLAFQPQLLPKRSWEKIMSTLDKHFGDSATLDENTRSEILAYLVKNSAETSSSKVSKKMLASIGKAQAPLSITETGYFKRKHREVKPGVFKRKSIGSQANCKACHPMAEKGNYDEHKVKIPKN